MISRNICVLFTVIGCFISVQPMPKYVISFKDIPCNFSWADDISHIYPLCDVNVPRYVPADIYLCAGLLKKSLDLCLLVKNLSNTDVLNKKPNIGIYDSNLCTRFKDFAINSNDTNWIPLYNKYFSSNSICHNMCVDMWEKVNPLCQYTMWVTDEFNKIRNKSVTEGVHSTAPIVANPERMNIPEHSNKADGNLRLKFPTNPKAIVDHDKIQTSTLKTELINHNKSATSENTTMNNASNKNSLIVQKIDSTLTSEPSATSVAQIISKTTNTPSSIKLEASVKYSQTVEIQKAHSLPIINYINVTDRETSYSSTTVRTTTKQSNPSDSVIDKSETMNNDPLQISTSKTVISDNVDEATGNEIDNTGEFTGQDDEMDEAVVKEPSADGSPIGNLNGIENIGPALEENEIDTASTVDQFMKPDDSHFFAYFMTMMVLCIIGYLVFHNKQKILALALEGRSRRSRRRPNTSGYRKLDSNLEEAITSSRSSSATNVIY